MTSGELVALLHPLVGLEVVGLAGKSYGLTPLNVDITNDPHTPERRADLQHYGQARIVDVVALPHRLPFPDQVFDYVVCGRLAELPDAGLVLREWMRVASQYVLVGYEVDDPQMANQVLHNLTDEAARGGFEVCTFLPLLPWGATGFSLLLARLPMPTHPNAPQSEGVLRYLWNRRKASGLLVLVGLVAWLTGWYPVLLVALWPLWKLGYPLVRRLRWPVPRPTAPLAYTHPASLGASVKQDSVCAVVVAFNPGPALLDNLRTLVGQVAEVLLIDNASTLGRAYLEAARAMPGVILQSNPDNLGVATALNQGADFAQERGYTWLATFDQDSRLTGAFMQQLLHAVQKYRWPDRVGIVVPRLVHPWNAVPESSSCRKSEREKPAMLVRRVAGGITSGSLVSTELLARERWRDDYFIDQVDHEFCFRVARRGYHTVEAGAVFLFHQTDLALSDGAVPPVLHPDRFYYITRNLLDMVYRHFVAYPAAITDYALFVVGLLRLQYRVVADHHPYALAIKHGWQDAVLGIRGPRRR